MELIACKIKLLVKSEDILGNCADLMIKLIFSKSCNILNGF